VPPGPSPRRAPELCAVVTGTGLGGEATEGAGRERTCEQMREGTVSICPARDLPLAKPPADCSLRTLLRKIDFWSVSPASKPSTPHPVTQVTSKFSSKAAILVKAQRTNLQPGPEVRRHNPNRNQERFKNKGKMTAVRPLEWQPHHASSSLGLVHHIRIQHLGFGQWLRPIEFANDFGTALFESLPKLAVIEKIR